MKYIPGLKVYINLLEKLYIQLINLQFTPHPLSKSRQQWLTPKPIVVSDTYSRM